MARMWSGVVPQQPPTMLTRPSAAKSPICARHRFGAFVILAECVGQAGVRIGADERVGRVGDLGQMLAHRARAERAIEADGEGARMAHRMPERGRRLAGSVRPERSVMVPEIMSGRLNAALGERLEAGEDRGLGVERVEDRFDQQEVRAAVDQPADLLAVGDREARRR